MAEQFKTRMATAEDESLLYRIFAEAKGQEFAPLGWPPEQLEPLLRMQYQARKASYKQTNPAAIDSILCLEDGTAVGRHLVERQPERYRTVDIAILAEYRNRGVGAWAIRQIQQIAEFEGVAYRLRADRGSPALRLYERLGFISIAGDELGFEMEWRSTKNAPQRPRPEEKIDIAGGQALDRKEVAEKVIAFVREIGLIVDLRPLPVSTFLPGIQVMGGGLRVDIDALLYPGDLLHEAGHLAVMPPEQRNRDFPSCAEPAEEMAAIAWSYAAAVEIGLPAEVVFHEHGYKGIASTLVNGFQNGTYRPGVPILWWTGMTTAPSDTEPSIYPRMLQWLRTKSAPQPEAEAVAV
jgi:ribosomal protein S18 acetylase RimI-like enzyme